MRTISSKSGFLSLLLFFYGLEGFSQVQGPLPDSCTRYENQLWSWNGYVEETRHYTFDPSLDTIIDGNSYTKLLFYTPEDTGKYIGGVRSDSGEVLFVPPDSSDPEMLWDFKASVGDTLRGLFGYNNAIGDRFFYEVIILDKDTQVYDGDSLEKFRYELFRTRWPDSQWDTLSYEGRGDWKEIQGSERGLLLRGAWSTVSGGEGLHEICLSDTSSSLFQYCEDCHCPSCPLDHSGLQERDLSGAPMKLHPNPASNKVRMTLPPRMKGDRKTLKAFTLQGERILERKFQGQEETLKLDGWKKGTYLIKVRTKNGKHAVKRLLVDH